MDRSLAIPEIERVESPRDRLHKQNPRVSSHHRTKDGRSPREEKKPMCAGVYRSHAQGDRAFELISLEDLKSVLDTGCIDDKVSVTYKGRRNSIVRRLSIDSRASTAWLIMNNPGLIDQTTAEDDHIDEETTSNESLLEVHYKSNASVPRSGPGHQRSTIYPHPGPMRLHGHFANDQTSLTIRKWRQHKQIGDSPMKVFAKDEMHFQLLERLGDKIAVSVPMPLQVEICKEVMPIIAATVVAYEKTLGKSNWMTKEAATRCKEMQEKYEMFIDL